MIDHRPSLSVIRFYLRIMAIYPVHSAAIVLTGFSDRILGIASFVLLFKTLLAIVNPLSIISVIDKINPMLPFLISTDPNIIPYILITIIAGLTIILFFIGKINLFLKLRIRRELQINGPKLSVHKDIINRRQFSLDQLTIGYDSITKTIEITILFIFLIIVILISNFVLGIMILISIPILVGYLVVKQKNHLFLINTARDSRANIGKMTEQEFITPINNINIQYKSEQDNLIFIHFVSSSIMTLILLLFFIYQPEDAGVTISAIILIICVRFSVMYAKEASITVGRLLNQRTIIDKSENVDMDSLVKNNTLKVR